MQKYSMNIIVAEISCREHHDLGKIEQLALQKKNVANLHFG